MSDEAQDLLVVGAGISGLGMARMARRQGAKVRVLEAGSRLGGAIHSHQFVTPEGSVWAELGAHTCYNSYGNLLEMLEETGQLSRLQPKLKLPFRLQIGDSLHSIVSKLSVIELLGVLPRLWLANKAGATAEAYFGRIIGRRNYARVLGPALDAVVCQPAAAFPADALFRKKPRRKEIPRSYTGHAGLQSFVEALAGDLDVELNAKVNGVRRMPQGYQVTLGDGRTLTATRLALAVGPDVAAELLRESMPDLAARLGEIEMAEIESQSVLLRAADLDLPRLAGIIGCDDDFYSVVSRDSVPDANYRVFTFHFRPGRLDQAGREARICRVLGVDPSALVESVGAANRLPALRLGQGERIDWIDRRLRGEPLGLTGNWFQGVSIEDSLIRSAGECARIMALG